MFNRFNCCGDDLGGFATFWYPGNFAIFIANLFVFGGCGCIAGIFIEKRRCRVPSVVVKDTGVWARVHCRDQFCCTESDLPDIGSVDASLFRQEFESPYRPNLSRAEIQERLRQARSLSHA